MRCWWTTQSFALNPASSVSPAALLPNIDWETLQILPMTLKSPDGPFVLKDSIVAANPSRAPQYRMRPDAGAGAHFHAGTDSLFCQVSIEILTLGHVYEGLGVVEDAGDPLPVGDAEAEVVVEDGEDADGVLGELLLVVRPEKRVMPGHRASEVRPALRIDEVDAVGPVEIDDEIPAGEEVLDLADRDNRQVAVLDGAGGLSRIEYDGALKLPSRIILPDGTEKCVEGRGVPKQLEDGSVEFDAILFDVTGQKAYQRLIEEQNARLREIAWMQSHVVRAPLARIMGLISLIEIGDYSDCSREELLQHVMAAAQELDAVIHEMVQKAALVAKMSQQTQQN